MAAPLVDMAAALVWVLVSLAPAAKALAAAFWAVRAMLRAVVAAG